jgi:uncharacterized membrane protein YraQ (UPF0718 family)
MNNENKKGKKVNILFSGSILFLLIVLFVYCISLWFIPEKALSAICESGKIIRNILWPLLVVLAIMVCVNLFIHPGSIVRLLGDKSGVRGGLLAAAAGIISMGPIYVWFPLLRKIRSKGVGIEPVAVFLSSRAVKPVLIPVMILCFGWIYTLLLNIFILLGAFLMGHIMGYIEK